jgi:hypothetical protein
LSQTVKSQPAGGAAARSSELRVINNDPATKASDPLEVQVASAASLSSGLGRGLMKPVRGAGETAV